MQKIVPNLWFDHNAEEAVSFYTSVFPDARIVGTMNYPTEVPDFQKDLAGQPVTINFELLGFRFIAINAGPEFSFTPAISFFVGFSTADDPQAREHLQELWAALADGGEVLMPLSDYPFSPHYGWVQDKYGVSWQLILGNAEGDRRPPIVPCLMFGHTAQNRAREALEYYASVFPDSHIGQLVPYPEATEAAEAGSVMFGDVDLAGVWIAAMDSGVPQPSTFSEAVSFAVVCEDQAEIDRYWEQLSKVPEAEQCGWCKDQFGVSWQVVPSNEPELLARPGAWDHLMEMKKLVIDRY
ncbi:Glyoxalase superfamily enzyme, possibly 3-demethylubiquinone-9 3-methyltransferase [Raineyella antarctica]|uniref:Glyoxalase superfamily enzyme, possibly 3-demethylubiquinone-9 3-methyltransferase n=1 Tax=Raineyella antarctica TaxID=1577474 RepID=A0A1G6I5A9_9ACTN|nr:VOC family protein [Raineyella antarctica]SDC01641.1 Glyoxalase superfamily enzyme, possibly 3-demethylubiquinone-9 3-methyltransferase [Raineyella antarctica]